MRLWQPTIQHADSRGNSVTEMEEMPIQLNLTIFKCVQKARQGEEARGGMTRASRLAKERVDRPDARPPACGAAAWAQEGWSVRLWIGVGPLREERREGGGRTGRRPSKPDMSAARRSRECRRPSPPARPPFVVPSFDVGSRSTLSRPSLSMTSHI